jgi:hypothetical protein
MHQCAILRVHPDLGVWVRRKLHGVSAETGHSQTLSMKRVSVFTDQHSTLASHRVISLCDCEATTRRTEHVKTIE